MQAKDSGLLLPLNQGILPDAVRGRTQAKGFGLVLPAWAGQPVSRSPLWHSEQHACLAPGPKRDVHAGCLGRSVLWYAWINLVRPSQNATFEIFDFAEASVVQQAIGLGAAHTALAVQDDLVGAV